MRTARRKAGSFLLLALLAGTGCAGSAAAPPDTRGLAALDAQATLAVWSARETAVAAETRRAEQATADTYAAAVRATQAADGATAQAIQAAAATAAAHGTAVAVEATATSGAGQVAATALAAAATATWDALTAEQMRLGIAATATADAAALAFQEQQAAKALAARQAEIDRAAMWTRLTPWLAGIIALGAAVGIALMAGTWAVERLRRTRPQRAGDVWVMVGPGGPVALNRPPAPPRVLPAELPRPALASPTPVPTPVPLPELGGHVLIAGETGSGKSTAMRAVLAQRGPRVVVLDPHYTEEEGWGAARVIGAGRDYEAIRAYMDEMAQLLRERYEARAAGRAGFDPLTVAVDEMPSIVDEVGREIAVTWRQWLREGRKVGLFLVLSTQSVRVRTLGIEGERDLLENFTYVLALGDLARREYGPTVAGMQFPAALVSKGRARPVIVPRITVRPSERPFVAGDLTEHLAGLVAGSTAGPIGDTPARPVSPLPFLPRAAADPQNLRPEDIERIRALLAAGWSQSQVEIEMFGYRGGAAWAAVRRVIGENAPETAVWEAA